LLVKFYHSNASFAPTSELAGYSGKRRTLHRWLLSTERLNPNIYRQVRQQQARWR